MLPGFTALIVGYLLGSIPYGLVLTRAAGFGDVRAIGSGSIGATNVLRTGSKKLAAMTVLLDALKGTAAVFAGWWIGAHLGPAGAPTSFSPTDAPSIARALLAMQSIATGGLIGGLGAFLGHIFPVWLGFKGGKGAATFIGVLAALAWPAALVFAVVWLSVAFLTRYSSLASLSATTVAFLYLAVNGAPFTAPVVALMAALLFWKHRENIQRLMAGTESKIGAKA